MLQNVAQHAIQRGSDCRVPGDLPALRPEGRRQDPRLSDRCVADPDPGSGAFLTPGSGAFLTPGSGIRCLFDSWIRDTVPFWPRDPVPFWPRDPVPFWPLAPGSGIRDGLINQDSRLSDRCVLHSLADPGFDAFLTSGSGVKNLNPGSGMNNQDHISRAWNQIYGLEYF